MNAASTAMPSATEWLAVFRRIVAAHEQLFAGTTGIAERTEYEGVGEGGDHSLVIDRRAEDVVFAELERLAAEGASFTAISEERGEIAFGDPGSDVHVIVDPIDGSLNFRRTIPSHSLSIAVAGGDSLADVEIGFVHDFGAGDEFFAEHRKGAQLNGEPVRARGPGYGLEVVGLEATKPELIIPLLEQLAGKAYRIRGIGSLAITLAYVAAGRFDGMIGARPTRSVDVAASQLIAREAGAVVKFDRLELEQAHLGLAARYDVVAALDEEMLGTLLDVQRTAAAKTR